MNSKIIMVMVMENEDTAQTTSILFHITVLE
jgi:hypothetical protein